MTTALAILTGVAMLATLGTLFAGVFGAMRADGTPARSNLLMRWRVLLQGATLVLFALLLLVMRR